MGEYLRPIIGEYNDKYILQGTIIEFKNRHINYLREKYDLDLQNIKDKADAFPYCCERHKKLINNNSFVLSDFDEYGSEVIYRIYESFYFICQCYKTDYNNIVEVVKSTVLTYSEKFGKIPNSSPFLLKEFIINLNNIIQDSNFLHPLTKKEINILLNQQLIEITNDSSVQKEYLFSNSNFEEYKKHDCSILEKDFAKETEKFIPITTSRIITVPHIEKDFIKILKTYFDSEDRNMLEDLMRNQNISKKIRFKNNGNKLTDSFKKLYEANFLSFSTKQELIIWLVSNFTFLKNGKTTTEFKYKTVEDFISSQQSKCTNPIIELVKENNKEFITKFTG